MAHLQELPQGSPFVIRDRLVAGGPPKRLHGLPGGPVVGVDAQGRLDQAKAHDATPKLAKMVRIASAALGVIAPVATSAPMIPATSFSRLLTMKLQSLRWASPSSAMATTAGPTS